MTENDPNIPPAPEGGDPTPASETTEKLYTKEELTNAVKGEAGPLRKEKRDLEAERDALRVELDEFKNAKLSDEERHEQELKEREAKLAEREAVIAREATWNSKRSVADKAGLPGEVAAALRTYAESDDPDEIAGAIKTLFDYGNPTTPRGATPGGMGKPPAPMDWATKYREAEKRGDAATCLALLNEKK
jgi:hypothetical protein